MKNISNINDNGTLCRSHISQLRKVASQLAYQQKMNGGQLVLGASNTDKVEEAEKLIYQAMNLLKTIA